MHDSGVDGSSHSLCVWQFHFQGTAPDLALTYIQPESLDTDAYTVLFTLV